MGNFLSLICFVAFKIFISLQSFPCVDDWSASLQIMIFLLTVIRWWCTKWIMKTATVATTLWHTPLKLSLCSFKHLAAHLALSKPFCPHTTVTPKLKTTTIISQKLPITSIFMLIHDTLLRLPNTLQHGDTRIVDTVINKVRSDWPISICKFHSYLDNTQVRKLNSGSRVASLVKTVSLTPGSFGAVFNRYHWIENQWFTSGHLHSFV